MRQWIDLFHNPGIDAWLEDMHADFDWDKLFLNVTPKVYILPSGTLLFHGSTRGWNPNEINTPAWFGDYELVHSYTHAVFSHEDPVIYKYRTTRDLRLIHMEKGSVVSDRILALLDGGEFIPQDIATTVIEHGWDGWYEVNGEIMIGHADA